MFDRRKAEVLGYVALAFVAVFLVVRLLDHASEPAAAPVSVEGGDGLARSGAAGSESQATSGTPRGSPLVVYVAGEVRRPGVYRVAPGSRAEVVVASAGGLTRHADGTAINLAAPVRDGQQLVVPRRGAGGAAAAGAAPAGATGGGAAAGMPGQPLSLSTATVAQLDGVDGIGPKLAGRIVQYRDAHGGFRSIDELRQVEVIGAKRFETLRKALQP